MTINAPNATSARADLTRTIGGAPAWVPTDQTGLRVWLDFSDTASITASGGLVSQVNDKSGGAFHFRQPTGSAQPATGTRTINSKNVLDFDGTDDYLYSQDGHDPPTIMGSATSAHAFYVFAVDVDPPVSAHGAVLGTAFGTSGDQCFEPHTDGNVYTNFGASVRKSTGDPTAVLTTPHVIDIRTASGAWAYNIDGATHYSTATNTVAWSAGVYGRIGEGYPGAYLNGRVAEVFVYNNVLTGTPLTNARNYLKTKWGTP